MKNNKQLSDEEIVQGCINSNPTAERAFDKSFRPQIFEIALSFTKNEDEAKDYTQDILIKLYSELKKHEITKSLSGLVNRAAENHCKDKYRKKHAKKALKYTPIIDDIKDKEAEIPGSKKYYESAKIDIGNQYKRHIPPDLQKSLSLSLEYIEKFYKIKEKIMSQKTEYEAMFETRKIFNRVQKDIGGILGHMPEKKKLLRYKYLFEEKDPFKFTAPEKKELEEFEKERFKFMVHKNLYELINEASSMEYFWMFSNFDPFDQIYDDPYCSSFDFSSPSIADYMYYDISKMKIKAPRLMYCIWIKAKGLRKGKYIDQKKLRLIFGYFKGKTKATEKESLFDPIDEHLSNFDSIRKSSYKNSPYGKFYKKLVDLIYQKSFIEKISLL